MNKLLLLTFTILFLVPSAIPNSFAGSPDAVFFELDGTGGAIPGSFVITQMGIHMTIDAIAEPGDAINVHQDENGLGAQSTSSESPNIDGFGPDETLVFFFDEPIRILQATFSNVEDLNDDFVLTIDGVTSISDAIGDESGLQTIDFDFLLSENERTGTEFAFTVISGTDDYKILELVFEKLSTDGSNPVGGTSIPIEHTSLILAGTQLTASWLIPVLVSAVGIGLILVQRK